MGIVEIWVLVWFHMYVPKRRLSERQMGLFMNSKKNKKVNCWLLTKILLMNEIVCLNKVCICLYFIYYVLLIIYQQMCWNKSWGNIDKQTWRCRRISWFWKIWRSTGRILLMIKMMKRGRFVPRSVDLNDIEILKTESYRWWFCIYQVVMIFGQVWRIISSWKSIITKQSNYVGYIINYF